jgi:hypothetical protein
MAHTMLHGLRALLTDEREGERGQYSGGRMCKEKLQLSQGYRRGVSVHHATRKFRPQYLSVGLYTAPLCFVPLSSPVFVCKGSFQSSIFGLGSAYLVLARIGFKADGE